jgi:hypothetical protein
VRPISLGDQFDLCVVCRPRAINDDPPLTGLPLCFEWVVIPAIRIRPLQIVPGVYLGGLPRKAYYRRELCWPLAFAPAHEECPFEAGIFPTRMREAPEGVPNATETRSESEALFRTRTGDPLLTMEIRRRDGRVRASLAGRPRRSAELISGR